MSRPKKYRRNCFIFRFPSDVVYPKEARVAMGANEFCRECRKPLSYKQKRFGYKYCSYKCSNKAKARKAKGLKRGQRNNVMSM